MRVFKIRLSVIDGILRPWIAHRCQIWTYSIETHW
jgi:hypothetical protein